MDNNINKKAIIFDRDGTLNEDDGYTYKIDKLKWKPGAIELIKFLNEKQYFIFVATNQSGIARGIFSENDMHKFHNTMQSELKKYKAHIDKFYFCPYHTDGVVKKYKKDSIDRKPNTGMLVKIREEWDLDKNNILLIGDKDTDIECAKNFNINGLKYNGKDNLFEFYIRSVNC